MVLGIMGPGRCGKDEAAAWLVANTDLKYRGSTSYIISEEVARREDISFEQAHSQRHARRDYWRRLGDEMRQNDAAALARAILKDSNLLVGVRSGLEINQVIKEGLCDLIVWIARAGIPYDPTLEFGPEVCDLIIENHWDLESYHRRLYKLAKGLGLLKLSRESTGVLS